MTFTTRRGRPRTIRPEVDTGTPELRAKRRHQLTLEPVDVCLERRIITPEQHRCALHLRWLYTLRYGAPGISCRDLNRGIGRDIRLDDPTWRESRELEYHEATLRLHRRKRYEMVMNIAIYNQTPIFLIHQLREQAWENTALLHRLLAAQQEFVEGLECLQTLWCKGKRQPERHGNYATSDNQLHTPAPRQHDVFRFQH